MADLRLKSIEIRNWMTVKTARIEFPEKGLVLVMGQNLAAEGKLQSVGAGKTALGEALSRTLLGIAGRYTHLGYFVSDSSKGNMYVKVEADLLRKPFTVEMGFRCKELIGDGEALKFTYGDEPFQAAGADQTRQRLEKTLQVTPSLANWTAFIDGDRLKFNKMSQEDSVNLLMTALAQPPWTEYYELANKKLQGANRQVAVSDQALQTAKTNFDTFKTDLSDAETDYKEAQVEYQRQVDELDQKIASVKNQISGERASVTAAEQRMGEIKLRLKRLEESRAAQNHQWEIERQTLRDQFAESEEAWSKSAKIKTQWETQLNDATDSLYEMKKVPKTCPKCGKPWDEAHSEQEMAKADKRVKDMQVGFDKAESAYGVHNKKRREINGKILEIEGKMRNQGQVQEVEDLGDEYDRNEKMVRNLNAMIQQRIANLTRLEQGVDVTFVNKKLAVVEERTRALENGKTAIDTAAADLAMDEEALKVVQYWHKAFSPTGIPNMILSEAIPLMNRVAQRISTLMTGGTLQINYFTTKELVRGDSKPQLVTKVTNKIGSKRLEGSSKGEGGLTNLIIAENLNEVGQVSSRIGFRWYDEVTSGQDAVVRRSIFAYLKDVAQRMGILIFVVDHHTEVANYADYVLVAEKTIEHGTRYFWR